MVPCRRRYVAAMTDEELLAAACPIIKDAGWAFYFAPATTARGAELGLDPFQFYALGRGGVLGDVEPAVVSSAFGYFNPSMVAGLWNAAKAICPPRVAGAAYMQCSAEHGRSKLSAVEGLASFVVAAEKVLAATSLDALPLFAGVAAEPAATDLPGSAHLVAVRAVGLDTKTAHFAKRPADIAMFGWSADDAPVIDDAVHAQMDAAEELTDRLVLPAFAVLDDADRAALVEGLQRIQSALAG